MFVNSDVPFDWSHVVPCWRVRWTHVDCSDLCVFVVCVDVRVNPNGNRKVGALVALLRFC